MLFSKCVSSSVSTLMHMWCNSFLLIFPHMAPLYCHLSKKLFHPKHCCQAFRLCLGIATISGCKSQTLNATVLPLCVRAASIILRCQLVFLFLVLYFLKLWPDPFYLSCRLDKAIIWGRPLFVHVATTNFYLRNTDFSEILYWSFSLWNPFTSKLVHFFDMFLL